jgi:hypothetical protein
LLESVIRPVTDAFVDCALSEPAHNRPIIPAARAAAGRKGLSALDKAAIVEESTMEETAATFLTHGHRV